MEMPEDVRDCGLVPLVHVRSLLIFVDTCGVVLDVTDLMIYEADA